MSQIVISKEISESPYVACYDSFGTVALGEHHPSPNALPPTGRDVPPVKGEGLDTFPSFGASAFVRSFGVTGWRAGGSRGKGSSTNLLSQPQHKEFPCFLKLFQILGSGATVVCRGFVLRVRRFGFRSERAVGATMGRTDQRCRYSVAARASRRNDTVPRQNKENISAWLHVTLSHLQKSVDVPQTIFSLAQSWICCIKRQFKEQMLLAEACSSARNRVLQKPLGGSWLFDILKSRHGLSREGRCLSGRTCPLLPW